MVNFIRDYNLRDTKQDTNTVVGHLVIYNLKIDIPCDDDITRR